jgi:hypothetical protein
MTIIATPNARRSFFQSPISPTRNRNTASFTCHEDSTSHHEQCSRGYLQVEHCILARTLLSRSALQQSVDPYRTVSSNN